MYKLLDPKKYKPKIRMPDKFSFDPEVFVPKFHEGDLVYVVEDGEQYATYHDAYSYFGHELPMHSCRNGDGPFKVIGVIKHETHNSLIYAIQLKGANYINLVGGDGIALGTYINY